jgi:hypothetical protein
MREVSLFYPHPYLDISGELTMPSMMFELDASEKCRTLSGLLAGSVMNFFNVISLISIPTID